MRPRMLPGGSSPGVSTAAYPDPIDQQFDFSLIQMLWDRGEGAGYAQHLTDDPLPGTPEVFTKTIAADVVKWAKVVKAAGLKVE